MSHPQTDKAADELLDRGPLPSLAWGLPSLVPETARAAWGARAIVHGACTRMTGVLQLGRLDIPYDRQDSVGDEDYLRTVLDAVHGPGMASYGAARGEGLFEWGAGLVSLDTGSTGVELRADTRGSCVYVYLTAWIEVAS